MQSVVISDHPCLFLRLIGCHLYSSDKSTGCSNEIPIPLYPGCFREFVFVIDIVMNGRDGKLSSMQICTQTGTRK